MNNMPVHFDLQSVRKSRRDLLRLGFGAASLAVLAACSPAAAPANTPATTTDSSSGEVVPTAAPATGSKVPVALSHTAWSWNPEGFKEFPAEYDKVLAANDLGHISLAYQQVDDAALGARMASGDAPDLLYVYPETSQPYAARNQILSLQSAINADPEWKANVDTFIKVMNDGFTRRGELIGICVTAEAENTCYNPLPFEKLGVPTPDQIGADAWTIDKLKETARAVTEESGNPAMKGFFASMEFNQSLGDFVASHGGDWFSDDGRKALFNTPEFVTSTEVLVSMVKEGSALNGIQSAVDGQWVAAALSNQLVATAVAGDWAWGWAHKAQLEEKKFQPVMFHIPSGPQGRIPIAHSAAMALYSQSKNREPGLEFLKLAATKEFQEVHAKLYEVSPQYPARHDAATPIFDKKLLPEFFPQLFENAIPSPFTEVLNPYPMFGYMYDMLNAVFKGRDTRPLQEVMDEMTTRAQKDLDAAAQSLG